MNKVEYVDYVNDLQGLPVVVGDRIAYAVTEGRSGNLRIGKVTEIRAAHERFESWDVDKEYGGTKVPCKLRIEVEKSAFSSIDKPSLIQADFKRFVRLTP